MSISDIYANTRGLGALFEREVCRRTATMPGRDSNPDSGQMQTMTIPGTQTTLPLVTRMFL
jgi:hypothetical protein